jgi:hypothetical protein
MRFCRQWQIYADDVTVRTGRVLDGVLFTDEEYAARVKKAVEQKPEERQTLEQAFRGLGFDPSAWQKPEHEKSEAKAKARPKTQKEEAAKGKGKAAKSDPSPRAHVSAGRGVREPFRFRPRPRHAQDNMYRMDLCRSYFTQELGK